MAYLEGLTTQRAPKTFHGNQWHRKHWRLQAGCFDDTHRLSSQMLSAVLTLSSLKARVVHMCAHVHVDMPVGVCTGSSEVSVICHPSLFSTIFVETGFLTHPGVGGFS